MATQEVSLVAEPTVAKYLPSPEATETKFRTKVHYVWCVLQKYKREMPDFDFSSFEDLESDEMGFLASCTDVRRQNRSNIAGTKRYVSQKYYKGPCVPKGFPWFPGFGP